MRWRRLFTGCPMRSAENIYENVTDVIEKSEKFQKTHVELMDKISETKGKIYGLPQAAKDKLAETTGSGEG